MEQSGAAYASMRPGFNFLFFWMRLYGQTDYVIIHMTNTDWNNMLSRRIIKCISLGKSSFKVIDVPFFYFYWGRQLVRVMSSFDVIS